MQPCVEALKRNMYTYKGDNYPYHPEKNEKNVIRAIRLSFKALI